MTFCEPTVLLRSGFQVGNTLGKLKDPRDLDENELNILEVGQCVKNADEPR